MIGYQRSYWKFFFRVFVFAGFIALKFNDIYVDIRVVFMFTSLALSSDELVCIAVLIFSENFTKFYKCWFV